MMASYIIHKIPKDGAFFIALTIKNAKGILPSDQRGTLGPQDKKIADALIKDFNAHKMLKTTPLEYGRFDKVNISDENTSFFLTELAKTKDVYFETKKVVIDALSMARLFFDVKVSEHQVQITPSIIDGSSVLKLEEIEAFIGQKTVWVLHKGLLKKLKQDARWLKMAQDGGVLTDKKKEQFLDHYENELPITKEVPEAKFTYEIKKQIACFPKIYLKNERGLFFDLKFNYESKGEFSFQDSLNPFFNKEEELFWESILLANGVKKSGREYFVSSPEQERIFKILINEGIEIFTSQKKSLKVLTHSSSILKNDNEDLSLELCLKFGDKIASVDELLKSTLKKNPIVELDPTTCGLIPLKLLDEFEVLAFAKRKNNTLIFKKELKGDYSFSLNENLDKTLLDLENVSFDFFNLKLLDFQKKGVSFLFSHLNENQSCLLADDMGLGKTIQVLAIFDLMKQALKKGVLVICPKSIKPQWLKSIETYLPNIPLKIEVLSFHELRASIETKEVSLMVVDEAQGIKNPKTQLFQKCLEVRADLKLALTGTPIENSYQDLMALFNFLSKKLIEDFEKTSVELNMAKIKRRLSPYILRRMKNEVLKDLPELFEQNCYVDMDDIQSKAYLDLIKEAKNNPPHVFALITKLRLAALDTRLVMPESKEMSFKTWQILEDISQIVESSQKVIVFSQFTSYLSLICDHLKELGLDFCYLDGQTKDRQKVVEEFSNDKNILVMSLKAGGVGLNLQMADYVLICDPWWNEAVEKQAIDRAYRLGRSKPVVAKRYLSLNTLETKLEELKTHKKALLDELGDLSNVTQNQLLDLILS